MHIGAVARREPDRPAVIMGTSGETVTFGALDRESSRLARLFRERDLEAESRLAILIGNEPSFHTVCWAAQRSGLVWTPLNTHLTSRELSQILNDSGATMLIASERFAGVAEELLAMELPQLRHRLMIGSVIDGWESVEGALAASTGSDDLQELEGVSLLYSSGTTGQPKGIYRRPSLVPMGTAAYPVADLLTRVGLRDGDVYLSAAPLYHAAPLNWSMSAQRLGAAVVVMERFDAGWALELIERHRVDVAQFVPTMLIRMFRLHEQGATTADVSSLRAVVHAGGPCPPDVKRRVIGWLGPIVYEYYGATEGIGTTFLDSSEWLAHPGSVGRAVRGIVHVLGDDGTELGPAATGTVWFEGNSDFEYLNDPEKTAGGRNASGYVTVGDIGHLDDDGYLYLTDRAAHTIIRGGVNIYPREIEDVLLSHPKVADAAVIGVADAELGERVAAVVEPAVWESAGPALEDELMAHCLRQLARFKVPECFTFERSLPRLET
ncbi:MAG: putative fatty-acid--CoA ligase, partial [Actinomycetia bacterium]|nr:putative fatty-acid--CoA ligase [Actinomycetes bacterium]